VSGRTTLASSYTFNCQVTVYGVNGTSLTASELCSITMNPGPATQFVMSASTNNLSTGLSFTVTLTAQDEYGNTAHYNGTATITYNGTGILSISSPSSVRLSAGKGSITIRATHSGNVTLTASITGLGVHSQQITINPSLFVYNLILIAFDANGNPAGGDPGYPPGEYAYSTTPQNSSFDVLAWINGLEQTLSDQLTSEGYDMGAGSSVNELSLTETPVN